jgi:hypothetical protein
MRKSVREGQRVENGRDGEHKREAGRREEGV